MVTLNINGKEEKLDVLPDMPLLWALRDIANLTGTKYGCGMSLCGACTVHLDGKAIRSMCEPLRLDGRRQEDRNHRRPGGRQRGQSCARGMAETRRCSMRLLWVRTDHVGRGVVARQQETDGCGILMRR